jgi:hypothetical protein
VPPPDFKVARDFIGLIKNEDVCIQFLHVNNWKYEVFSKPLSKEMVEKAGFKIIELAEDKINRYHYKMVVAENKQAKKFIFFMLGDDSFSVNITVFGLEECDENEENQIKLALLSIIYNEKEEINHLAELPFELDESQSIFKLERAEANALHYALREHTGIMMPTFTALGFPKGSNASLKDVAEKFFKVSAKNHMSNFEIKQEIAENINGYEAYQVESKVQAGSKQVTCYQLVVANDSYMVMMSGICYNNGEYYLAQFKKFGRTIKIKNFN